MDNKITLEFLKKARATESAEALVSLAKENGIELTEEQAAKTYEVLHPQGVAISDDELGSVSGGISRWRIDWSDVSSELPTIAELPKGEGRIRLERRISTDEVF